jgi:phosphohistidine swiveling domain-containing protein
LVSSTVASKTVMTQLAETGTHTSPVPEERRSSAVLSPDEAVSLASLGVRIEDLYGVPMDIEWAVHNGEFVILQARPVTALVSRDEWNDSLLGDYLWTNGNVSEAVPSVMTPVTWSVIQALAMPPIAGHPTSGNIGGRFYLNLSVTMAMANAFGMGKSVRQTSSETFGQIPDDVPPLPMSRWAVIKAALPVAFLFMKQGRAYKKNLSSLLATTPSRCSSLRSQIAATDSPAALLALWRSDVDDLLRVVCQTLDVGARQVGAAKLGPALRALVGEADANALLSGLHSSGLASLGPMLGLAQVHRGEVSLEAYAEEWGHRGPDEYELFVARPGEDPSSITVADDSPEKLLDRQSTVRTEAWERLTARYPRKAGRIQRQLDRAASVATVRERARSEMVRTFWVFRAFVLRAGELTGHGDDLFFLTLPEILTVLGGDSEPLASVAARRSAYAYYSSLPPCPALIRGRFDPSSVRSTSGSDIVGFAGGGGIYEGVARVVHSVSEAQSLSPGEVLVTAVTNVGWTPLFPRAGAVVTDVGAPLSHAAIVARELGIPAVVGCGNATSVLATGDRVRVDGGLGVVARLSP